MRTFRFVPLAPTALFAVFAVTSSASAQQRPLATEDPETIGAGRILIEAGLDVAHDQQYPLSGLRGDLWRVPALGLSFGLSSIAELQIDGGLYNKLTVTGRNPGAPFASLMTFTGDSTHDFEDVVVGMKVRLVSEDTSRPAIGVRFATKLPDASNESGLGTDSMDFHALLVGAKTVESIRVVANAGFAILSDPTQGNRQNDVLLYGLSFARAITQATEMVGELNGRLSTRSGGPFPGTESRGLLRLGGRYTHGPVRFDGGLFFGLTSLDPTIGFTVGATYVFNVFNVP